MSWRYSPLRGSMSLWSHLKRYLPIQSYSKMPTDYFSAALVALITTCQCVQTDVYVCKTLVLGSSKTRQARNVRNLTYRRVADMAPWKLVSWSWSTAVTNGQARAIIAYGQTRLQQVSSTPTGPKACRSCHLSQFAKRRRCWRLSSLPHARRLVKTGYFMRRNKRYNSILKFDWNTYEHALYMHIVALEGYSRIGRRPAQLDMTLSKLQYGSLDVPAISCLSIFTIIYFTAFRVYARFNLPGKDRSIPHLPPSCSPSSFYQVWFRTLLHITPSHIFKHDMLYFHADDIYMRLLKEFLGHDLSPWLEPVWVKNTCQLNEHDCARNDKLCSAEPS